MKRRFLLASIFLLVVGIFAFGQAQKELTALWFYDDPSELEFLNKKAAEYSTSHPGVTIKVNTVAYNDLFTRLTQLVAGNNPPDIVKLTDIRPEIEPFILDLSKYHGKDFFETIYPGRRRCPQSRGENSGSSSRCDRKWHYSQQDLI
jgi:ABC-type sugar transport system, periplasmic component